jgi:class 3 adenylate cyclase
MSERLKPAEVVDRLNQYLHVMEEIIFRYGGTVDKFGGDSIMAFWGVLVERKGAVLEAVSAAMEMQNALFYFNYTVGGELVKSPLGMGIGLNTGEMVSGNVGSSDQKIEFTVIGDAVNTAQRIESKAGRGQVFVSDATFKQVKKQVAAVKLPPVEVKNKAGLVQMYSIRCTKPADGAEGVVTNLQVSVTGGGAKAAEGLVVWAIPDKRRTIVDLCSAAVPSQGSELSLQFKLAERPDLPTITGRVVAARKTRGPGSAMVEIPNCPKDILQLVTPGHVVAADITADQVVRV